MLPDRDGQLDKQLVSRQDIGFDEIEFMLVAV